VGEQLREAWLEKAKNNKPKFVPYEVAGLGTVYLKRLNIGERTRFEEAAHNAGDRARVLIHCCFDERGARIFDDEDYETVKLLDPDGIDDLVLTALTLNKYTKDEQDKLLKNVNGQAVTS
jgi:hypothetical protein